VSAEQASSGTDSGYAVFHSNTGNDSETVRKEFTPYVSSQAYLRLYQVMPVFERDGYAMTGYNALPGGAGREYEISDRLEYLLSTNQALPSNFYAQWTPVTGNHVLYIGGMGETSDGKRFVVRDGLNDMVTLADENTFSFAGRKVIKWATKPDQSSIDYYMPGETVSLSGDMTLYAIMGVNSITLHYNDRAGAKSVQKDYYSRTSNLSSGYGGTYYDAKIGKNMVFLGWNSAKDGSGTWYSNTDLAASAPKVLYAQYTPAPSGSYVIYKGNGAVTNEQKGFVISESPDEAPNTDITLIAPPFNAPYGKNFLGWNTNAAGIGTWYQPGETLSAQDKGIALYAIWGTNVVFYHHGDPNGPRRMSTSIDSKRINRDPKETQNNYVCTGWNTEPDGSGTWYGVGDLVEDSIVLHLYNHWEELPEYYYLLNDWKLASGHRTEIVSIESAKTNSVLPSSTGGNRTLFGWYDTTQSDYTVSGQSGFLDEATNIYAPGSRVEVESGDIFTALTNRWGIFIDYMSNLLGTATQKRTYYAVTSNQELQLYSASEVFGSDVTDKTFTGWNTKADGSGTAYSADDYVGDGYLTLYAQWKDSTQPGGGTSGESTTSMYRMYNPNNGEHFYTRNERERDHLMSVGWKYEGIGFYVPNSSSVPVYRAYSAKYGDHMYTRDQEELNRLLADGWTYEGIAFYSASEDQIPLYRLHNPNAHPNGESGAWHFTSNARERDVLVGVGWVYQGIAWYSLPKEGGGGHVHAWSSTWQNNETHHWHNCSASGCTVTANSGKNGYGAHRYTNAADATCNDCGYEREIVHVHDWAEAWQSNDTHHWHECTAEGCTVAVDSGKDSYGTHRYTNAADATCNDCGYEREVIHNHDWSEVWKSNSTHHWHECTAEACTVTANSGKNGYGAHNYVGDTCEDCGYDRQAVAVIPMYRVYNPNNGEHHYTKSAYERDTLVSLGWKDEGTGFYALANSSIPVYRAYSETLGDHMYTRDREEFNKLLADGWNDEGIAFYSALEDQVPMYRLYNPNAHRNGESGAWHFTSNTRERDVLMGVGWIDQGIAWYSMRP